MSLLTSLVASKTLGKNWVSPKNIPRAASALHAPSRQAKIALKANSEDELLELEAIAKSLNLAARSILDAYVTMLNDSQISGS